MKTFKTAILTVCLLAVGVVSQGCFLLLLGGAGATVGAVKYAGNTLQVTHEVSLDNAWSAATGALKKLGLPVTVSKKDELSGHLEARNAQEQLVSIDLLRNTEKVTQIRVTVGTFDTTANRAGAQQVYLNASV